jgi:hypothetical protein
MPVMVPLTSALKETPSSTAPPDPLLTVAGTVLPGQMVCWAAAFAPQTKTTIRPNSIAPARLKNFALNVSAASFFASLDNRYLTFTKMPPQLGFLGFFGSADHSTGNLFR